MPEASTAIVLNVVLSCAVGAAVGALFRLYGVDGSRRFKLIQLGFAIFIGTFGGVYVLGSAITGNWITPPIWQSVIVGAVACALAYTMVRRRVQRQNNNRT